MKLSELIQELVDDLARDGDVYIFKSEITTENETTAHNMWSRTRKKENGERCKMSFKEFQEWVKEQKGAR